MNLPHLLTLLLPSILLTPSTLADQTISVTSSSSQALSAVSSTAILPQSTPAAPAVNPIRLPNGDPCGPNIQDNPNYPNTCNLTPSLVQQPNPYGINCSAIQDVTKYPLTGVLWDNCAASLTSICSKMEDSRTMTGMWIYSMLADRCALGFWLPVYDGSAPRPSTARCFDIFTAMVDSCKTTTVPSDHGSINLNVLPSYLPNYWTDPGSSQVPQWTVDENATGAAVDVGYPSYIVKTWIWD